MSNVNTNFELLTLGETSEWLKVKVSTLRKWAAERRMPIVRVGRGIRVPVRWVEDTIRQGYQSAVHRDGGDGTEGR